MQGIQRYILARLRHRKFYDINNLNDAIGILLDDYNNKIVKHLQQSRTQMFESLDRPHLRALPSNRYSYRFQKTKIKLMRRYVNSRYFDATKTNDHKKLKQIVTLFPHILKSKNGRGLTGLMQAVASRNYDVITYLLYTGIDANVIDRDGLQKRGRYECFISFIRFSDRRNRIRKPYCLNDVIKLPFK